MQTFHSIQLLNIQLRHIYVLKLLIMLEINLITVIHKKIGKVCILNNLNSTAVNGNIFIKNLQGGTFAFEHLYLQISHSNIPYEFFWGSYCIRNRNQANKWIKKQCFCSLGVKPLIHQSELRKKFLSLCSIVKTTEWNGLIKIDN